MSTTPAPAVIRQIIREAAQQGVTASSVMRKHGITETQFYAWKQAIADMLSPDDEPAALRAVIVRQAVAFSRSQGA